MYHFACSVPQETGPCSRPVVIVAALSCADRWRLAAWRSMAGTAIVLGGGGVLGAVQVGMLRALVEAGERPDLVLGTSVGAINGAVFAALPPDDVPDRLTALWSSAEARAVFAA